MSSELASEIFSHIQEHEKPVYKAMIQNLASPRKLRPIFIERKPKKQREIWLQEALSKKGADDISTQLFQIWLLGSQREMICQFLDSLGIKHDGKGVVDDLPAEPTKEALNSAVESLLSNRRSEIVSVYLHAFQAMDDAGWPNLSEILASDPRLSLGDQPTEKTESSGN